MITEAQAEQIKDILAAHCGWHPDFPDEIQFMSYLTRERFHPLEYRFQGALGFGGKFRVSGGRWYVDCYPEDSTPDRERMIRKANERLSKLQKEEGDG